MHRYVAVLAVAILLAFVPAARAIYPTTFEAVPSNPAEQLATLPIEAFQVDPATHCQKGARPGTKALAKWLGKHAKGENWGIYRCEKWGKHSASLHAEGRALDWRLNVKKPREKKEAIRLISMMLAPDAAGRPAALARRMGVQEIIWDCQYWGGFSGQTGTALTHYSACTKGVDKTTAHRNHVHFGLNKRGAAKQTSWWTRVAPPPQYQDTGSGSPFPPPVNGGSVGFGSG
jgi:hypothetical protein